MTRGPYVFEHGDEITWRYYDQDEKFLFDHRRYVADNERGKDYSYLKSGPYGRHVPGKPPGADALLWRLPDLLTERDADVWWTEGERDCAALVERALRAVSHHGGAGKVSEEQAEWLRGYRGHVYLVADRDVPGAYDVCRRFDLLRAVGLPASRLTVLRAAVDAVGADVRDHLAAGYAVEDLVRVSLSKVRRVAEAYTPADFIGAGYLPPVTDDERAQLKNWKPTTVTRP